MKTTISLLIIMVIGFICFKPKGPNPYPPKEVLQQKDAIVFKEAKIDMLIHKIQYEMSKDSLELKYIKSK